MFKEVVHDRMVSVSDNERHAGSSLSFGMLVSVYIDIFQVYNISLGEHRSVSMLM